MHTSVPELNPIGIMQGRLSPPGQRAQAFPWDTWETEFERAHTLGYDAIEWLFDGPDFERNPLWTEAGRARLRSAGQTSGVSVNSICANYFMWHPFVRVAEAEAAESSRVLTALVGCAHAIGATVIVLPVLEQAEIRTAQEQAALLTQLRAPLQAAQAQGISLALETELPANDFLALLAQAADPALGVCYDTGNATARGYSVEADLRALAPHLSEVHIKDRPRGGPNVTLGTGGVDFERAFATLVELGYRRPVVLETTVGDDYYRFAQCHHDFVRAGLSRAWAAAGQPSATGQAP